MVHGELAFDIDTALADYADANSQAASGMAKTIEHLLALEAAGLERAHEAVAWAARERTDKAMALDQIDYAPPVTRPEKIIGVGLNYRDHCDEIGRDHPSSIQTFGMFANTLVGHRSDIVLARKSKMMDWEAELVIVIGKPGKHIPESKAMEHVAGFAAGNDISARDFQKADPQAMRGKSGDTHSPLGPWIVTRDELPDDSDLDISLTLNGATKQHSNTGQRTFQTPEIVSFLSTFFTFRPGDLIYTGTPGGVGMGRDPQEWLQPGDEVAVTIEGIGTLSNRCVMER